MRISRMQIAGMCVAALVVVFAIGVRAQDEQAQSAQGPSYEQKSLGVSFVRALATAEMRFYGGDPNKNIPQANRFGSLDDLQREALLTSVKEYGKNGTVTGEVPVSSDTTAGAETIPGYHLDLVVSGDGKSFDGALRDTNKADHGFMVFIDDHGVIYFGQPLQ